MSAYELFALYAPLVLGITAFISMFIGIALVLFWQFCYNLHETSPEIRYAPPPYSRKEPKHMETPTDCMLSIIPLPPTSAFQDTAGALPPVYGHHGMAAPAAAPPAYERFGGTGVTAPSDIDLKFHNICDGHKEEPSTSF